MKKQYIILVIFILVGVSSIILPRKSQRVPYEEMLIGVDPNHTRLLWDDYDISYYMGITEDKIVHVLYEVEFEDGFTERRGYLDINDGEQLIYLGPLSYQLPDASMETQFIEIAKYRFIIFWVDDSITQELETVSFNRPYYHGMEYEGKDDRKTGGITGRGGIIPIFPHWSFALWNSLESIEINYLETSKIGKKRKKLEAIYSPPLEIDSFFKLYEPEINLLYKSVRLQPEYSFWFHGGDTDMQITVDKIENEPSTLIPSAHLLIVYETGILRQGELVMSEQITISPNETINRGGYEIEVLNIEVGKYIQTIYLKVDPGVQ